MSAAAVRSASARSVQHETRRMLICVGLLAFVGLSAAVSCAPPGQALQKLGLHCVHLSLGLGAFLFTFSVPVERMRRVVPGVLAGLFCVLVAMQIVPGLGRSINGATRWIGTPPWALQPATFVLALWPVALSSWAAHDPLRLAQPRELWKLMLALVALLVPILIQPDFGSVAILAVVTGMTLFFAGAPIAFLRLLVPVCVGALFLALVLFEHVDRRLISFLNRTPGFQELMARDAFAVGGLTGTGPGLGVMKNGWVPEGETDYILALIAEEWGLVGSLLVWTLFVAFTVFGVRATRRADCRYGVILMAAATLMISIHAALNMAVVTGAVPPKGLPLPFVSRGGSAVLALSGLLGIAVRAAHERRRSTSSSEWFPWTESNVPA